MTDARRRTARAADTADLPPALPDTGAFLLDEVRGDGRAPCRPLPERAAADDGRAAFLRGLGDRVRTARTGQGMSRKALARLSGVSERHLAQLEAGAGNMSVLLLREVAQAANVPLTRLLDDGPGLPAPRRGGAIALLGMAGAGRTALGRGLARRLNRPFVAIDDAIAADTRLPAAQLAALCGPEAYAQAARRCLERTFDRHADAVVVTGGFAPPCAGTLGRARLAGTTVWVRASVDDHLTRLLTPDGGDAQARRALADGLSCPLVRHAEACGGADITIETTGRSVDACLTALLAALGRTDAADVSR